MAFSLLFLQICPRPENFLLMKPFWRRAGSQIWSSMHVCPGPPCFLISSWTKLTLMWWWRQKSRRWAYWSFSNNFHWKKCIFCANPLEKDVWLFDSRLASGGSDTCRLSRACCWGLLSPCSTLNFLSRSSWLRMKSSGFQARLFPFRFCKMQRSIQSALPNVTKVRVTVSVRHWAINVIPRVLNLEDFRDCCIFAYVTHLLVFIRKHAI